MPSPGPGTAAERVGDLEALQDVAALGLAAHNVHDLLDELAAFGVVALRPVVAGARLPHDKLSGRKRPPNLDPLMPSMTPGSRSIIARAGRSGHWSFIVVDADPLELEVRVAPLERVVADAMLGRDALPELVAHLVSALPGLAGTLCDG